MKPIMERENGMKIYIIGCLIICLINVLGSGIADKLFQKDDKIETNEKDDFYANMNNDIIENHELEGDKEYWSIMFTETQDNVDDKVEEIIKKIILRKDEYQIGTSEYKICKLYESIINQDKY